LDPRWVTLRWARQLFALATIVLAAAGLPARANAPAPEPATAEYEVRFMEDMIEHHMMAVHMSEVCLAKAVHPELRQLCEQIIAVQQQEIATMEQWLAAWYGVSNHEHRMNPGHHHRMEKLAALSGASFEIEFMKEMIRHHRMAVVKASQCAERAYHDALQDLCEGMASSQLAEIRQMEDWLCAWYGLCRPRHGS
jgi:uncharacterized protein (DUF305 family)